MKFVKTLKAVALASAFVASAPSMAAYTFVSGSAALTFSNDLFGVFGTISAFPNATPGSSTVLTGTAQDANGNDVAAVAPLSYDTINTVIVDAAGNTVTGATVTQPATSVTLDAAGTAVVRGLSATAGVNITRGTKTVTLTNFVVDQASHSLYADITALGKTTANVLLAVADPVAPFAISSTKSADGLYHAGGLASNLILDGNFTVTGSTFTTTGALNLFTTGLGVTSKTAVQAAYHVNMGNLVIDTAFTNAVPEPSTYGLMGLGLAAAGFVARRKSQQA